MFKTVKGIFVIIMIAFIGLTACRSKESPKNSSVTVSKHSASADASGSVNTIISVPGKGGNSADISITQKKITIYTLDDTGKRVIPVNSAISTEEDIKPESIIEAVLLELDEKIDDNVGVTVKGKGDSITVNFTVEDKEHPFGKNNSVSESLVLDCISYSIFDNFDEYKKIYFKLNGEAYKSKQLKLPGKKPFMVDE